MATDLRLYLRDEIVALQSDLRLIQSSLVGLAAENEAVLIPGYTHLQRAQPIGTGP